MHTLDCDGDCEYCEEEDCEDRFMSFDEFSAQYEDYWRD